MTASRAEWPGFLGIGVARGGTTWLWENLRHHPEVWLSPVKEISYFDRRFPIVDRSSTEVPEDYRPGRMLSDRLGRFRWSRLRRYLGRLTASNLAWQWRFYRYRPHDDWYGSLFPDGAGRLAGDITPHYSALPATGVRHAVELLPQAKWILILRDPIARDWSSALNFLSRYGRRSVARIGAEEFRAHLFNPETRRRGDYLPMLDNWTQAVPPERFLLGFHDDLARDPVGFFERICRFLEIDSEFRPASLERRINAAPRRPVPAELLDLLAEHHLPALEELADRYGNPVTSWRDRAREVLTAR